MGNEPNPKVPFMHWSLKFIFRVYVMELGFFFWRSFWRKESNTLSSQMIHELDWVEFSEMELQHKVLCEWMKKTVVNLLGFLENEPSRYFFSSPQTVGELNSVYSPEMKLQLRIFREWMLLSKVGWISHFGNRKFFTQETIQVHRSFQKELSSR